MALMDFKYLLETEGEFRQKVVLQLKRLRKQKMISQERFYMETNINIARLETGRYGIRLETIRKICYYFDITISAFFQDV